MDGGQPLSQYQISNISIPTGEVLSIIFLVVILIFIFASIFLVYHWRRYDVPGRILTLVSLIYFGGSAVFLGTAAIALLTILV